MAEELKRQGVDAMAELSFNSQQILRLKVYGSTVNETAFN